MVIWYSFCRLPRWHRFLILLLLGCILVLLSIPSPQSGAQSKAQAQEESNVDELQIGVSYPLAIDFEALRANIQAHSVHVQEHEVVTVQRGDSLSVIFSRLGFASHVVFAIDRLGGKARILRKIHPGEQLSFYRFSDGSFRALSYALDERQTLWIEFVKETEAYRVHVRESDVETRLKFTYGTIEDSFWKGGLRAGLNENLIMKLATIFSWDIDFAQDIRPGDRFTVIYEQYFRQGEYLRNGNIIAAEFVNQKELFQAIRHQDNQYYDPAGAAMRKSFLRAPVSFKYISSNFNPRRLHPVTGRVRPHNGIDYAARIGTPVVAAGDGIVVAAGYNRFNGNYLFIKHSEKYMTKYLHLNRRYVKKHARVKQGQRIGSVGRTGRVTGPHLHYEFLVNGVHKNPRTVSLPKAKSLKGKDLKTFKNFASQMTQRLNHVEEVWLATVVQP